MTMPDSTVVQPTYRKFHIHFCTVARWNEQGEIVEENLFYTHGHAQANRGASGRRKPEGRVKQVE